MQIPFYKNLPGWMTETLDGKSCSRCKKPLEKQNVIGVGIKYIENSPEGKCTTFLEFKCLGCGFEARFSFENIIQNSIERLCYMLLDQIQKRKKMEKSVSLKPKSGGPITDDEVQNFLKELEKTQTHEDFLKLISAHQYIEPDIKNED